jgi:predicted transcriptional regulator
MKIYEIRDILNAVVLEGEHKLEVSISAGGGADLMDDVMSSVAQDAVLLTGLISENVIQTAKVAGVSAIVFVRGKKPGDRILKLARSYDLPILVTDYSLFVSCGRLYINGLRGLEGSW